MIVGCPASGSGSAGSVARDFLRASLKFVGDRAEKVGMNIVARRIVSLAMLASFFGTAFSVALVSVI